MLTIFCVPKAFKGHFDIIQRNAITSWTLLKPRPEIILFGDEEGTAEICRELDLRHEPNIVQNEFGTPLVNDVFAQAQRHARSELLCFVNADIIFMSDFVQAVEWVQPWRRAFLMVGRRLDMNIDEALDFSNPSSEQELRHRAKHSGTLRHVSAIDYLIFRKGLFASIPAFAIGRCGYDNWLLWYATQQGAVLIDATQAVTAIHQNHDYSHVHQLKDADKADEHSVWTGVESRQNRELMDNHRCTIKDATHRLTASGIKRNVGVKYLRRRTKRFRYRIKDFFKSLVH